MRKAWWVVRRGWKDLMCWAWLGAWLTEYCTDCGIRQPLVWAASDRLWEQVAGHRRPVGDNAPGVLCPRCFNHRAARTGMVLAWVPSVLEPADSGRMSATADPTIVSLKDWDRRRAH